MRILAGRWAGRHLHSPSGRVRPTSEDVRDRWMDLLGGDLKDARILELFAGSGAVGLEALSRGARSCDFVENNPSALHALKANVAALRVAKRTRVFKRDAIEHVRRADPERYDLVLADPPYGSRQLDRLLEDWSGAPFAPILAVEHAADHGLFVAGASTRIGDAMVTVLRADR